jgi:hypothetical protein
MSTLGLRIVNSGQMEEYLAEFAKAAKVNPPGAVAQLDIPGAQLTLDKVLEADATMANNGTNAIEAFRAAMQYRALNLPRSNAASTITKPSWACPEPMP